MFQIFRNFEDSEDELRHDLEESLEKVVTAPTERTIESSMLSINRGQTHEKMSLPSKLFGKANDDLENNCESLSIDTNN